MKKLLTILAIIALTSCAPAQHVSTAWTMSWQCYTNYCASHVSPASWGGNGTFSSESDCLVWETGFLNTAGANGGGSVTACTGN